MSVYFRLQCLNNHNTIIHSTSRDQPQPPAIFQGISYKNNMEPKPGFSIDHTQQLSNMDSNISNSKKSPKIVSPISFGVEIAGGIMERIILKGTPLPAIGKLKLTTFSEDQPMASIKIYAGERIRTEDNILMVEGKIEVMPIPRIVGGSDPTLEIEINLNSSLLVKVSAPGEKYISLALIHMDFTNLEAEALKMSRLEAQDKKERERVGCLQEFKDFCRQMRALFGQELAHLHRNDPELPTLFSIATETWEWLKLNLHLPKATLKQKYLAFEDVMCPKLKKLLDGNVINEFGDAVHDMSNSDIDSSRSTEDDDEDEEPSFVSSLN
ncbi:unnamed protein product [Allacma fusca]|uniref:Uncharacterized protein n=1 Tax=Allacma fusca TaxID=39272 RepID=A0A8J2L5G0_9HEXA|nr:unnamed protein product [Allacma fusca]